MFEEERHEQIVQLLKGGRMVSVGEIAKQLFVSEATVRRDLTALERAGVLRRIRRRGADRRKPRRAPADA